jgi:acylglycerol lipase
VIAANGYLAGAGGRRIYWQSWKPESDPQALVVIVHGAGEHSGRYGSVAETLVQDGYAVYALDHRGHGRSDGPRALIDRLDRAVADLDRLVSEALAEHPALPVFVLGHSMGGTIAVRYALGHQQDDSRATQSGSRTTRARPEKARQDAERAAGSSGGRAGGRRERLTGMILSGPLLAIEAGAPLRFAGRALSVVAPTLPLIGIDPALVSRDPQVVAAYESDPLVHHGKLPVRTLAELVSAIDQFPDSVAAITVPTLILYGTADRLCPPSGSGMLAQRIGSQDKTVKAYDGLYHEILNEPERDEVLADIRGWLSARVGKVAGSSTS